MSNSRLESRTRVHKPYSISDQKRLKKPYPFRAAHTDIAYIREHHTGPNHARRAICRVYLFFYFRYIRNFCITLGNTPGISPLIVPRALSVQDKG